MAASDDGGEYRAGLAAWQAIAGTRKGLPQAIRTCRQRGWAAVHVPGEGFRPCGIDEPGAVVDLDRYAYAMSPEADLVGRDGALQST